MEVAAIIGLIGLLISTGVTVSSNEKNMQETDKAQNEARAMNEQERTDNLRQKASDDAAAKKTQDLNVWLTEQKRQDDLNTQKIAVDQYNQKEQENALSGLAAAPTTALNNEQTFKKNLLSGLV